LAAIKEYENNKWKVIGQKVNKPAKACEQHAKEHFPGKSSLTCFASHLDKESNVLAELWTKNSGR
jgi:hypothetical protein